MVGGLTADVAWVLVTAFLVALMQAGFTCLESGFVRAKNSINVAMKNLVDFCLSSLLFTVLGYQIMFGQTLNGWFALPALFDLDGQGPDVVAFFIFQLMFCGTAATIISGAVSERMSFSGYIIVTVLSAGVLYPIAGHWVWNGLPGSEATGWLGSLGFVDFAGSTVVHSVGGWIALSAILVIGPRLGRFGPDGRRIEGHDLPMAVLGVFLLWFGFFGFNGGSTLALSSDVPKIIVNTALAGATGGMAAMVVTWSVWGRPRVDGMVNGVIAGLVASCAGCNLFGAWDALAIGAIAGVIAVICMRALELVKVDDVIGAVPSHLAAGVWGTLAVAIFVPDSALPTGDMLSQLRVQALGVGVIGAFTLVVSYVLFRLLDMMIPFRVPAEYERQGLNIAEHGASSPLLDIITQMDSQTRQGDVNKRLVVEPETEAGHIAQFYNTILDRFSQETDRRREDLQRLADMAERDALTGVANRRRFLQELDQAVRRGRQSQRMAALVVIDVDHFRDINERFGSDAGDVLLKEFARRLTKLSRGGDVVARLDGDQFGLLLDELRDHTAAEIFAEKVAVALSAPMHFPTEVVPQRVSASLGMTLFGGPLDSPDMRVLLRCAESALREARAEARGAWRIAEAAPA